MEIMFSSPLVVILKGKEGEFDWNLWEEKTFVVSFVLIKFADELPSTNNGNRNRFYTGAQCNHIALIVHMDGFKFNELDSVGIGRSNSTILVCGAEHWNSLLVICGWTRWRSKGWFHFYSIEIFTNELVQHDTLSALACQLIDITLMNWCRIWLMQMDRWIGGLTECNYNSIWKRNNVQW